MCDMYKAAYWLSLTMAAASCTQALNSFVFGYWNMQVFSVPLRCHQSSAAFVKFVQFAEGALKIKQFCFEF